MFGLATHTSSSTPHRSSQRTSRRRVFARHLLEMLLAMFAGMGVLAGLGILAFEAAGSSLTDQAGWFRVTWMAFSMTLPMLLWMRHRGHAGRAAGEMAGAMLAPSAVAAGLAAAGALGTGAALAVQHAAMVPAMIGLMLWRYDDYAIPPPERPEGRFT